MTPRDHPRFEQVVRRAVGRAPWSLRLAITATAIAALLATSAVLHLVPGMTHTPLLSKRAGKSPIVCRSTEAAVRFGYLYRF